MGSKQKRRIARAEQFAKHAQAAQAKAEARIDTLDQKLRDTTVERNRLRSVLGIEEKISHTDPDRWGFTVYFDRRTLALMKQPPADVIHAMVESHIVKAGLR